MATYLEASRLLTQCAGALNWEPLRDSFENQIVRMEKTPQDSVFHAEGDVWTHTKMVLTELVRSEEFSNLCAIDKEILLWAAFLHDVAKPITTVIDPETGKISQPGHSAKGAVDSRILLWGLRTPFQIREQVCALVSMHQTPFFTFKSIKERSPEFLVHKLSQSMNCRLLAQLAKADIRGRICPGISEVLSDIELFEELCKEQGCYEAPYMFADEFTRVRYFKGENVDPKYSYHIVQGSDVTLMCGMPASGKDSWVQKLEFNGNVVSFDDAKAELGLKHGENDGKAAHFAIDKAKSFLRKKEPFVWNSTNLSKQMRSKSIDLLLAYNARVRVVYLEQPRHVILQRNQKRDTTLSNKHLEEMLLKWETPCITECHELTEIVEV